jgi:hypothetical protein
MALIAQLTGANSLIAIQFTDYYTHYKSSRQSWKKEKVRVLKKSMFSTPQLLKRKQHLLPLLYQELVSFPQVSHSLLPYLLKL